MSAPIAYGIDFGTTNSSIAVVYPNRVEVLEVSSGLAPAGVMPSMCYLHRNGVRRAGREAAETFMVTGSQRTTCPRCPLVVADSARPYTECRQYRPGGSCLDSRLIAGLKNELSNQRFSSTHSWATDFAVEDLVALVIGELRSRAGSVSGASVDRVVLGHPAAFVGTESDFEVLQRLAEKRLVGAAERAGFREVELFPEPAAAVLDEQLDDGVIVSVDFGGGTFDVAVIEVTDGEGAILALRGAEIGGALFDGLIFDAKVAPRFSLGEPIGADRPIPGWFRAGMRSIGGLKHLLTNPATPEIVLEIGRTRPRQGALIDAIIFGGQATAFYGAIERAKIDLSRKSATSIEFHPPGLSLSIRFTREELDLLLAPYLDEVEARILASLAEAGVGVSDVTTVVRTGGSSLLEAFVRRLDALFGPERVRAREAFTSVAYGLGVYAQELWS